MALDNTDRLEAILDIISDTLSWDDQHGQTRPDLAHDHLREALTKIRKLTGISDHEADQPIWLVTLDIDDINVSAETREEAINAASNDVVECLRSWEYGFVDADLQEGMDELPFDRITGTGAELELEPEEGDDTWVFCGTVKVYVQAETAEHAYDYAVGYLRDRG